VESRVKWNVDLVLDDEDLDLIRRRLGEFDLTFDDFVVD